VSATKPSSRASTKPVEDPRLSKRRAEVERSKTRRRLLISGAALGLVAIVAIAWFLVHSSLFSASSIKVTGKVHETKAEVIRAAGLEGSPPLISIDETAAASGIERLAWVKTAKISLHWPSSVTIALTERYPAAVLKHHGGYWLVDETGRVLDQLASQPAGVVLITGLHAHLHRIGGQLAPRALPALKVASSLPPAFRSQVAVVLAHPDGTISLALSAPVGVELGTTSQLGQKYRDVASVLASTTLHPGDVIDVSVPQASTITGP